MTENYLDKLAMQIPFEANEEQALKRLASMRLLNPGLFSGDKRQRLMQELMTRAAKNPNPPMSPVQMFGKRSAPQLNEL